MPILKTKLFIPPPPLKAVARPRLIETLQRGKHHKLTLISAPAGFGKTLLVTEWLDRDERSVAWLSLDEKDSDLPRFLNYLLAAVETVVPGIGRGALDALQAPQPPPAESILTALLNELGSLPDPLILVLDDYHVIDSKPVDDALTFLLEHLPPQVHLVMTTREDPQLPLPRLRARGQVTELRAADLRFTPPEAAEFLNSVMGLDLSVQEITELEARTEGWIAGLQLAALAVRGHLAVQAGRDVPEFIHTFAGDNRYVVDYLLEEVLQRQPEAVRQFLLKTSILEQLNGALCDYVTGLAQGDARLAALERGNFFVIPLDDKRQWYRYHHLFAQVLYARLKAEQPEQIPLLHQRASEWYEQNGSAEEAIRHAFAAKNFERAADLIELDWPAVRKSRQDATRLSWLRALPRQIFTARPVLSVEYAHALLAGGVPEGVEELLRYAEQWLESPQVATATFSEPSPRMVVVDAEAFRNLPGAIAIARAGLALGQGNVQASMRYSGQALQVAQEDDYMTRGGAAGFLGLATWTSGDLEGAYQMYALGMANLHRAGSIADTINGAVTLANIRVAQGRLRDAMSLYERGLELAATEGSPGLVVRGTADIHVGMSELEYEHNALQLATRHLEVSKELGELAGFPQNRHRWCIAMARIRQAQGDFESAIALLNEGARLYVSDFSPNIRPIAALQARVWIAQRDLGQAIRWARGRGLSPGDELSYIGEFEHITLARLLIAQYKSDGAQSSLDEGGGLLARLLEAAEGGARMGSVIEILMLQAIAHLLRGEIPLALMPLERALELAEPEGYVRLFLDEGETMAQLLGAASERKTMLKYAAELRAALQTERAADASQAHAFASSAREAIPEPLTERELEILRLFSTELSGPEIADKLVIALSTLRTHTKNIYGKLNVSSRRAAVNRARELDLI